MNGLTGVRKALKDPESQFETLAQLTHRQAKLLGEVRMVLLFIQLIEKIVEEIGLVTVFDHAESEALEQRYVVDVG